MTPGSSHTTLASQKSLIQPMFDGPVDVIGDVHGEIDALRTLMSRLGYDTHGRHPQGRRLVFLGDLVDRGPDSPAVVELVADLVTAGRSQCVMGNHELNILLEKPKADNVWFYPDNRAIPPDVKPVTTTQRQAFMSFFGSLPLAVHREDLRAVHACWDDQAVELAAGSGDARALHDEHAQRIDEHLKANPQVDEIDHKLAKQNRNPVKLLTSGPECRAAKPFHAGGKLRHEARDPWWDRYDHPAFCVFGHYWRTQVDGVTHGETPFAGLEDHELLGKGRATCIDFSVGSRAYQRRKGITNFTGRLGALRLPEYAIVDDIGNTHKTCDINDFVR
ncbi:MAG: hypothetical protein GC164_01990 [Phycisphaera sp.]|nr:hypothetical protein [Phycisphaera sp.]